MLLSCAFMLLVAQAAAEEFASIYTSLDLTRCKDVTPPDMKDYGTVWTCRGHDGLAARVVEGDLRIFVSYGPNAETQTAAYQTQPQFNGIGRHAGMALAP